MEKTRDRPTGTESKTRLVEQISFCLRSGDYARALEMLRSAAAEFPNDAEFLELEKRAQDGVQHKAEADRLITESQELFARQKSAEAIQLLRKAYELDKNNSLARAILANALVEHAQSIVETDWLEAEKLSNQALALNPAHPTAKSILSLIVHKKETSPVDDWVSQARKLHSSGDLFAALAWVAEGLAVHPHDPKLLQIQDAVQRDQEARRRQARRGDLDDLRRLQQEIAGAADAAAKQSLVGRIQAIAAKHWTDGEILSIANALLLRLGMLPQESSTSSQRRKGGTVIFHVPRPSAPEPPPAKTTEAPTSPVVPVQLPPKPSAPEKIPTSTAAPSVFPTDKVPPSPMSPAKVEAPPAPQPVQAPTVTTLINQAPVPAAKVKSSASAVNQPTKSKPVTPILAFAATAVLVIAAILFFARKHQAPSVPATPAAALPPSAPALSTPTASTPAVSAPAISTPEPTTPETAPPAVSESPDTVATGNQPPAESVRDVGTLLVSAGQDGAKVILNGKLQRQLTRSGQLRLPNLAPKDYVVQVSKSGFQDPPQQNIQIRKGEEARLIFNLQPQLRMATLTIQGAVPGTAVLVDQAPVGTIQSDGSLNISSVNPGDHTVELRKERFKPRQLKKHFVAGGSISLAAADAALEAAPAELKITFAPADANVAIVKGDLLKMVSSGVPLNLPAGTYTLTARTADRFTRSATLELNAGESKTLDLSLAPHGMTKWEDPAAWKHEGDSFTRRGGEFVLYGAVPASGTFTFSATLTKGHQLQWVLNYTDPKNYVLLQMDDNNYYRSVIRNGEKSDEIIVPHKGEKKAVRTLRIRVSPTEIVHQFKKGESWTVLDRWTQPGTNLSQGKFGFYIPGSDQVALSSFAHYADLNIR